MQNRPFAYDSGKYGRAKGFRVRAGAGKWQYVSAFALALALLPFLALAQTAAGVMNTMPPRENPRINKSVDSVHAQGPLGRAHCVIHGNCNYKQTGMLQAYAAYSLLQVPPRKVGFASGCQAFGHRELLGQLRSFGLAMNPILTVHT